MNLSRNKFWLHSGRKIGDNGFSFNRPACTLCDLYDGRECGYKYCAHCFLQLLFISGMRGSRRRRAVGAIVRRTRKLYQKETQ